MIKIIKHIVVYKEKGFYATFPSVVRLGKGKLMVAFRRAPDHRYLPGAPKYYWKHGDAMSKYMYVTSDDNGDTWSPIQLLYAPPEGGSQDGALFYDGEKYLYAHSFIWKSIPDFVAENGDIKKREKQIGKSYNHIVRYYPTGHLMCTGFYAMRSADKGQTWEGPYLPDPIPGSKPLMPGYPQRPFGRSNIVMASDGSLLSAMETMASEDTPHSLAMIYRSTDHGETWRCYSKLKREKDLGQYEPYIHIAPSNKWVMLIRVHPPERALLFLSESQDEGKTWSRMRRTSIHAEPSCTLRMDDGRALVAYGYRQPPFGVRMKVCDSELTDIESAREWIIRDDGDHIDVGYPWLVPLGKSRFLLVYYLNRLKTNGPGHVAGTVIEVN